MTEPSHNRPPPADQTPEPRWSIGVVVPARNEADAIARCLASVRTAAQLVSPHADVHVVVVADCCTDDTARIARTAIQGWGEVLLSTHANVGAARRDGTALILRRLAAQHRAASTSPQPADDPLARTWLLTTDADTTVLPEWVVTHLRLARAGAVGVAGMVAVDSFADHPAHVERLHRSRYVIHADGSHPHVHGANLGFRADAYLAVGGWRSLTTAEDHDLWDRLRADHVAMVSTIESPVTTSGRRAGRAPLGFANHLALLGTDVLEPTS